MTDGWVPANERNTEAAVFAYVKKSKLWPEADSEKAALAFLSKTPLQKLRKLTVKQGMTDMMNGGPTTWFDIWNAVEYHVQKELDERRRVAQNPAKKPLPGPEPATKPK